VHAHHHPVNGEGHGYQHHETFGRGGFTSQFGSGRFPHGFGGLGGRRARRGDVRAAIVRLLSERPMHGYQVIQELSERSGGAWTPSAGSVYPALQMLADEGLIVGEEAAGKKVFRLTEAGTETVAEMADQPAPWRQAAQESPGSLGFHVAVGKLMRAVFQIGKSGSTEQVTAAVQVLNDARKRLYTILAED
jgi:DNA-binding PadR family transcriptional regulator